MKTMFTNPSKGDIREVTLKTPRYWLLMYETETAFNQPWMRWTEFSKRSIKHQDLSDGNPSIKYVLDVIEDKVIHCSMTLRELEMMQKRHWPLKAKMLEAMAERAKAKKSRRTIAAYAREMEER